MLNDVLNVFKPGLGLVRDTTATIYVDPTVPPVFCRSRLVPYALQSEVETELNRWNKKGLLNPFGSRSGRHP